MSVVGKIFESKLYGPAEVFGIFGDRALVQFQNTGNIEDVHRVSLYQGTFCDHVEKAARKQAKLEAAAAARHERLHRRTTHGVGYLGDGPLKPLDREKTAWRCMMRRCYSKEWHDLYPQYEGCEVCERWHSLQNFVEDFRKLENYDKWLEGGYQLDKDIKVPGNKIYGPDTCSLVTSAENSSEAFKRSGGSGKKRSRTRMIQCPDGEIVEVTSLPKFCEEHGLSYQRMLSALNDSTRYTSHKGYSAAPLQ